MNRLERLSSLRANLYEKHTQIAALEREWESQAEEIRKLMSDLLVKMAGGVSREEAVVLYRIIIEHNES